MKKIISSTVIIFTLSSQLIFGQAVTPEISSWIVNANNAKGYNDILSNVLKVQYSVSNVYVSSNCIPGYDIGPWTSNPNTPSSQDFTFKITRTPQKNTGTAVSIPLGHIGIWKNGVSIYNAKDGMTYNNKGIWNRDALKWEGVSFDNCLGHPASNGEYHLHVNPKCLYDDTDNSKHSPLIGFAFDGFPIYGAYGYANATVAGTIKRIETSYRDRNITDRATTVDLNGNVTTLSAANYGPAIDATYPLGSFIEDREYITGLGDLDERNGRYCVTPEYPNGTYAYFVTINSSLYPVYPYVLGSTYYGTVQSGNTGPGSGHVTISETVTLYTISGTGSVTGTNTFTGTNTVTGIDESNDDFILFQFSPNPVKAIASLSIPVNASGSLIGVIYSASGNVIETIDKLKAGKTYNLDLSTYQEGTYY